MRIVTWGSLELQIAKRPLKSFDVRLPQDRHERDALISNFSDWLASEERSVEEMADYVQNHFNYADRSEGGPQTSRLSY